MQIPQSSYHKELSQSGVRRPADKCRLYSLRSGNPLLGVRRILKRVFSSETHRSSNPRKDHSSLLLQIMLHWTACSHFRIHSSKLTWKWRGAPHQTTIPYAGPSVSFHVSLCGKLLCEVQLGCSNELSGPVLTNILVPCLQRSYSVIYIKIVYLKKIIIIL